MENKTSRRQNPPYHLLRNASYALDGLRDILRTESSFRIEVVLFVIFQAIAIFLPVTTVAKAVLSVSLFIPLLAELANSAIERAVDLVTQEFHEMAKRAKDAGSALVFMSFVTTIVIWGWVLYVEFLA
ncbi:diacylglycerol kinase [Desulfurispirillum indicum]|uniref:Diacylglycerol kinase n=1 Tax=Desulfurispirillum indicum (strain ATCC BAA-1389 / DSM 22839 / S5) TaxID=653733 RepID=E6W3G6_DESIS|nr:diacylglycerol kinase [Desulfurispirillum indicum]ADU65759.1 diacylglycerol kinase [Desulfurispirillum indicum S5]UCZ57691.1 diacylglycerol kinase [Desulfurispirillum indicum]